MVKPISKLSIAVATNPNERATALSNVVKSGNSRCTSDVKCHEARNQERKGSKFDSGKRKKVYFALLVEMPKRKYVVVEVQEISFHNLSKKKKNTVFYLSS